MKKTKMNFWTEEEKAVAVALGKRYRRSNGRLNKTELLADPERKLIGRNDKSLICWIDWHARYKHRKYHLKSKAVKARKLKLNGHVDETDNLARELPIQQPEPVFANFCPHCGGDMRTINTALNLKFGAH